MKRGLIVFVALILIMPVNVKAYGPGTDKCDEYNAETKTCTINICKNDCRFDNLLDSFDFNVEVDNLVISLEKNEYILSSQTLNYLEFENIYIDGNNSTLSFIEDLSSRKLNIYSIGLNIMDLNINMPIEAYDANVIHFDNVNISNGSGYNYGLSINRFLDNIKIENSKIPGVVVYSSVPLPIQINNSDLTGAQECSIFYYLQPEPGADKVSPFMKNDSRLKFLGMSNISRNGAFLTNSKINCAKCDNYNSMPLHIYIDSTNEWEDNRIVRDENVLELSDNTFIMIERADEDTVSINAIDDLNLNNYFNSIDEEASINWVVQDEEIAVVRNNRIIPLKVGSTLISGEIGHDLYTLRLNVTEDMINPTPTVTPTIIPTPSPSPVPNDVIVPDTYNTGLFVIIATIFTVIVVTYYYISKEEE